MAESAEGNSLALPLQVIMAIFCADVLTSDEVEQAPLPAWLHRLATNRAAVLGLLSLLVLAPLLTVRRLGGTVAAVISALGILAVVVWTATTAYLAERVVADHTAHDIPLWPRWDKLGGSWLSGMMELFGTLPVIICAFM